MNRNKDKMSLEFAIKEFDINQREKNKRIYKETHTRIHSPGELTTEDTGTKELIEKLEKMDKEELIKFPIKKKVDFDEAPPWDEF